VDFLRIGRSIRAIRVRANWRQSDLADRCGLSRSFVSKVERGMIRDVDLDRLERLCLALGADLDVRVRWRGEGLDRLLDEAHATLVDRLVGELQRVGWQTAVEVTFNEFGDRGSVDVLGWHERDRALLVVEVKSVVPDAQAALMPLDRKTRLGRKIGQLQGWEAATISRVLVVADRPINRRRINRLSSMFDAALPARNRAIRQWLRSPDRSISGLLFVSDSPVKGIRRRPAGRLRVNPGRRPRRSIG
jgi:transcriptional regulator with XRE-family HTH domain